MYPGNSSGEVVRGMSKLCRNTIGESGRHDIHYYETHNRPFLCWPLVWWYPGMIVKISPYSGYTTTPRKLPRDVRPRSVPPYNVILENDDYHSAEFVVEVLAKALGLTTERAYQFMLAAHKTGRAVVWTAPREVAELKAEQIQTFHEVRDDGRQLGPVSCAVEPAAGD